MVRELVLRRLAEAWLETQREAYGNRWEAWSPMAPAHLLPVMRDQLEYLRAHIREAIAENRIACLECGAQFRKLGRHVREKHGISLEAYRAGWGYNRLTSLVCGEALARFSALAKARGLGTTNTREMELAALRAPRTKGATSLADLRALTPLFHRHIELRTVHHRHEASILLVGCLGGLPAGFRTVGRGVAAAPYWVPSQLLHHCLEKHDFVLAMDGD